MISVNPKSLQKNRLVRHYYEAIVAFFLHVVTLLKAQPCLYEALDSSAVPTGVKGRVLANEPTPDLGQSVERARAHLEAMAPQQCLQKAGVLSGNFWLFT